MEAKLDGNDVTVLFGGQPVDSMASANLEDTAVLLLGEEVVRAIQYEDGGDFHRVDPEAGNFAAWAALLGEPLIGAPIFAQNAG